MEEYSITSGSFSSRESLAQHPACEAWLTATKLYKYPNSFFLLESS